MLLTYWQAKYIAHALSLQHAGGGMDRLSQALFNASVDLNPHQIDAAIFALQSPLSGGALLADEVGLGKTIEAGIVLCQLWAERKRQLLVICPASLRQQWAQELEEKFHLPAQVLDAKTWAQAIRQGRNPFKEPGVVIMSYAYAMRMKEDIRHVPWNLVVMDEAHKLRNAYRESNKIGQALLWALEGRRKLLLTATPLQNSVMELYGLSTFMDPQLFGDTASFRSLYAGTGPDLSGLRQRLAEFSQRTLRRQVGEYVRYTQRKALTQKFQASDEEHRLYEAISSFLQKPPQQLSYAIPRQQRHLTQLILRKLLASSSHAIAGTLGIMQARLQTMRDEDDAFTADLLPALAEDEDLDSELLDEILYGDVTQTQANSGVEPDIQINRQQLQAEIDEITQLAQWAQSIGTDTKTLALLKALDLGFQAMESNGAPRKALVFTESKRTQDYLLHFLQANGYAGQVLAFNGSNKGDQTATIYSQWLQQHQGSSRISGSRDIDIRSALIDHFREHACILIATEAAAEGVNMQFCSLVINYDLPWNPQRVEQRIGRCHRYGQAYDVVVINFFNERNHADQRVLELLDDKFKLFDGLFGASDEILGSIESGLDFERRILSIYQSCRTPAEIDAAFDALRRELDASIQARLLDTRRLLLENLDGEVHERLKLQQQSARDCLDHFSRRLWDLSAFVLQDYAQFNDSALHFDLHTPPVPEVPIGRYHLLSKNRPTAEKAVSLLTSATYQPPLLQGHTPPDAYGSPPGYTYRLSHPLGEYVLSQGQQLPTPMQTLCFDTSALSVRVSMVEALRGQRGYLLLQKLSVDSFERQDYLLFSALSTQGNSLDQESCEKLMTCPATVHAPVAALPTDQAARLQAEAQRHAQSTLARDLEVNNAHFQQARERLDRWADDMVLAAEKNLTSTKEQLRAAQREARLASSLAEQHIAQEKVLKLQRQQRRLRQEIFQVEDDIDARRVALIERLSQRMTQQVRTEQLFTIAWEVV